MVKAKSRSRDGEHEARRVRAAKAMHNLPAPITDQSSYEEMLLSKLLEQQQEHAKMLKALIEAPDGIGFTSPHYLPTLQSLLALAHKIDGFRHAFSTPLDGVQIPTLAEKRRWNAMLKRGRRSSRGR